MNSPDIHNNDEKKIQKMVEEILLTKLNDVNSKLSTLEKQIASIKSQLPEEKISVLVISNDYEKLLSILMITNVALALDIKVTLYFTLWGLFALKKETHYSNKNLFQKMMSFMMPKTIDSTQISKFNMFGLGTILMKKHLKDQKMYSLSTYLSQAIELGAKIIACEPSMAIVGVTKSELIENVEYFGLAPFLTEVNRSKNSFII